MKIGQIHKKPFNTSAKCRCGELAKYKVTIEINRFRGDDDYVWSCDKHKTNLKFLTTKEINYVC